MHTPADPVLDASPTAARRSKAVQRAARAGIAARTISVLCTLAQVPIALRYLGAEGFGLWITLSSIAGLLQFGDLGLNLGAKTILAHAYGKDPDSLKAWCSECLRILIPFSLALAFIGTVLAWTLDWPKLLGVENELLRSQLPWAFTVMTMLGGFSLLTAVGATLAAALQLTWVQHGASAVGSALTLAIVAASAAGKFSWLSLVIATLALPLVMNVAVGLIAMRDLGAGGSWRDRIPSSQLEELKRLSRWFFVPQIGSLFMTMGVPAFMAAAGGPVAVAAFNLLQRVFGLVGQVHWMALSALWPAYSEARARGDHGWMRSAYRQSWRATLFVFVPGILVGAIAIRWIVQLWVGEKAPALSLSLILSSAVWFALQLFGQPPAMLLNGLGRLRGVAIYGTAGHLVSLAGMVVGGKIAGPTGVIVGMTMGYALVGLPGVLIDSARAIRNLGS